MKPGKVQSKNRSNRSHVSQRKSKQIRTKPTKTTKRTKSTSTSIHNSVSSSLLPSLSPLSTFSKTNRISLTRVTKRHFGGCGSACGCGPAEDVPAPEAGSSCGTSSSSKLDTPGEFDEPQFNEQNIKTVEKMRKQQRDFSLRLYRSILRAHRNLPSDMRMLGDSYVQEEFKLHKNAKPEHLQPFFEQWIDYLGHLRHAFDHPEELGKNIPIETIDQLDDEQKEKLFKMHDETYRIFGGENAAV